MGRPKLELLASNGVATSVMPFSITLNARHTHIKQTHTCIYRHTHAHAQTHPHTSYRHKHTHTHHTDTHTHQTDTHTHTHHTDTHTHNMCCVCVCVRACVCTWQSTNLYMITPCNGQHSLEPQCTLIAS